MPSGLSLAPCFAVKPTNFPKCYPPTTPAYVFVSTASPSVLRKVRSPAGLIKCAITTTVQRLTRLVFAGILVFAFSGVVELVQPEPCGVEQSASQNLPDGACPVSCVRCHCATAFEVFHALVRLGIPAVALVSVEPAVSLPQPLPHDILHVPLALVS